MEVEEANEQQPDNLMEFTVQNVKNPNSPWFWLIMDDDDDDVFMLEEDDDESDLKVHYGRGNAKSGARRPYILYQPSTIYQRVCFLFPKLHSLKRLVTLFIHIVKT